MMISARRSWLVAMAGVLVAALLGCTLIAVATEQSTLDRIISDGVMNVGVPTYRPWSSINPDTGEWEGITIDLMNELAAGMGVEANYIDTPWSTFPLALQTEQIDIFAGTAGFTVERGMKVAFPYPIFLKAIAGVCRPGEEDKYLTYQDLNDPGVTVSVGLGTYEDQMSALWFPKATLLRIASPGSVELMEAVVAGQADVGLSDHIHVYLTALERDDLAYCVEPFAPGMRSFPVRYGDAKWYQFLDSFFMSAVRSGLVDSIVMRWYPDVPAELLLK